MTRIAAALLALVVGGCTTYADPSSFRAPRTVAEQQQFDQTRPGIERVAVRVAQVNQDICATPCPMNVKLGVADGVGAFANRTEIWLPIPMAKEMRTDDERALVLAHEWAHVLFDRGEGFDAARELRADCVGAMLAKRAGFDPVRGADLHRRLWSRENGEKLLLLVFGVIGGGAELPWPERIAMIERAAATPADKAAMAAVCGVRW